MLNVMHLIHSKKRNDQIEFYDYDHKIYIQHCLYLYQLMNEGIPKPSQDFLLALLVKSPNFHQTKKKDEILFYFLILFNSIYSCYIKNIFSIILFFYNQCTLFFSLHL